jgi:glycosyltransferase involved in cell wall biosynthesis
VLCISESTRRDLQSVYGSLDVPIVVTPLGVGNRFSPRGPRSGNLPHPFALFVGDRTAYKDFFVLLEAFATAQTRFHALVAVGGGPFAADEEAALINLGIRDRVLRIDASDSELERIYRSASVFVFPSRYEGFGLPTLEAMASGCPVILADSSSHPEVGGQAALYFPPGDVGALRDALERCSDDHRLRERLRSEGLAQAARLSWRATAEATASAYRLLE